MKIAFFGGVLFIIGVVFMRMAGVMKYLSRGGTSASSYIGGFFLAFLGLMFSISGITMIYCRREIADLLSDLLEEKP
jgi:small neutral amino acid transporter SnatA (MarC family)